MKDLKGANMKMVVSGFMEDDNKERDKYSRGFSYEQLESLISQGGYNPNDERMLPKRDNYVFFEGRKINYSVPRDCYTN